MPDPVAADSGPKSAIQTRTSELLEQWTDEDARALDALFPLVYDELRRRSYLRSERPGHTLQSTALVHEAYLRR